MDTTKMQAGNFLNLGMLATLLFHDDMYGVSAVLVSWAMAYANAFITVLHDDFMHLMEYTPRSQYKKSIAWTLASGVTWGGCVGSSMFAIYRVSAFI